MAREKLTFPGSLQRPSGVLTGPAPTPAARETVRHGCTIWAIVIWLSKIVATRGMART